MKKLLFIIMTACVLVAFKGIPVVVNPAFFGKYQQSSDSSQVKVWVLKEDPSENKIGFYMGDDIVPKFVVTMKDSTHFKTAKDYADTKNGVTHYWSAHGTFLPDHQMELVAKTGTDISSNFKLTFTVTDDEKIIYTKK